MRQNKLRITEYELPKLKAESRKLKAIFHSSNMFSFCRTVISFCLALSAFCVHSFAQNISATLDREKILIGEQVTLQLKAENINEAASFINTWFQLPDSINSIIVVKKEPIDTIAVNGTVTYIQRIRLTSFDSGKWAINPMQISFQDKVTGKKKILKTPALTLEVLPVDVSAMLDYHPLKEIIDVEVKTNWWLILAIAVSAVILLSLIYLLIKRKKKIKPIASVKKVKGTPLERAMEKLQHLQEEDISDKKQIKLFHSTIDTICRTYLQESLNINALHITASEVLLRINVYLQTDALKQQFAELIRLNTAVKFAKFLPDTMQSKQTLQNAIFSLQQLDIIIQQSHNNAH